MALSKKISAMTAAVMLTTTAAAFPPTVVSATTYDDASYASLSSGDVVQIDTFDELCYFSSYVNSGGATEGITWQLTADINAGSYTYNFDEATGLVIASDSDGNSAFCLGSGVSGTNGLSSEIGTVYAASSLTSGVLTTGALPEDAQTGFSMIADSVQFKGIFDGNGYKISGLYGLSAMFGTLKEAEVYNLTISDSYFYNASGDAASVALKSKGTDISYVTVEDTFVGCTNKGNIGGIVACVETSADDSDSAAKVIASQCVGDTVLVNGSDSSYYTGGIIGTTSYMGGGQFTVEFCNNSADIYGGNTRSSGVAGYLAHTFAVKTSLSSGNINSGTFKFHGGGTFVDSYQIPSESEQSVPSASDGGPYFNYITSEQVSSGEITYIMENLRKASDVTTSVHWTQDLANGGMPILSESTDYLVCCSGTGYENGSTDKHTVSGEYVDNGDNTHSYVCANCSVTVTDECDFVDGSCSFCGRIEAPSIVTSFGQSYYQINNYSQLCWFADAVNSGTAKTVNAQIMQDIEADSSVAWVPIGTASAPYSGTFNGQNHTVSGLNVSEGTYVGLFGYTSGANISNFGVENSSVSGTNYVGAFIGTAVNTTVMNCYAYNNTVTCDNTSSGFIATSQGSTVISFSYTNSDKGLLNTGTATIIGCFHSGQSTNGTAVTSEDFSSGYVAYMLKEETVKVGYANEWGQDLRVTGSHPILDNDYEVFCTGDGYDNLPPSDHDCENVVCNSDGTHQYDCAYCMQQITENCRYVDGFCSICGHFDNDTDYIYYKESGTYTLPTPKSSSATEQVIGWISSDGVLYQCGSEVTVSSLMILDKVTLNLNTIGASVRLNSGSTGIKFATAFELNGADYEALDISVGTLICPTDYVTNDSILDYDYFVENEYIALIQDFEDVSFDEITVNDTIYGNTYTGSIININAYNYAREFTGCGFIEVTYSDGSVSYFYASAKSSQSVYTLAVKAFGDRVQTADDVYNNETIALYNDTGDVYYSRYTDGQLDILKRFIDGVVIFNIDLDNQGGADIIIPEEIISFYELAYYGRVDYSNCLISIVGTSEDWRCYIPVTKSTGEVQYQRVSVMINGKRITYANTTDNFEIPVSVVDADSDAVDLFTFDINIVGIEY